MLYLNNFHGDGKEDDEGPETEGAHDTCKDGNKVV
jgi:hypothetical protein